MRNAYSVMRIAPYSVRITLNAERLTHTKLYTHYEYIDTKILLRYN
jgi:hypothetical protein